METQYMDKAGITHDVEIYTSYREEDLIFTVHRNGGYFCDLIHDDGRWTELFDGPTERSEEYGALIDKLTVFNDRRFRASDH